MQKGRLQPRTLRKQLPERMFFLFLTFWNNTSVFAEVLFFLRKTKRTDPMLRQKGTFMPQKTNYSCNHSPDVLT